MYNGIESIDYDNATDFREKFEIMLDALREQLRLGMCTDAPNYTTDVVMYFCESPMWCLIDGFHKTFACDRPIDVRYMELYIRKWLHSVMKSDYDIYHSYTTCHTFTLMKVYTV